MMAKTRHYIQEVH